MNIGFFNVGIKISKYNLSHILTTECAEMIRRDIVNLIIELNSEYRMSHENLMHYLTMNNFGPITGNYLLFYPKYV